MKQRVLSWAFLALLVASVAAAQQGTTELRGRVVDAQGAVLPGVTVTVRNQETGMFRETVSGGDGSFIASGLVPGTYQVSAELQGFKRFERRDLRLEVGKTASIDVTMAVGALEETITVTTESPLVDVTSKEIGGNITSDTLVNLPSVNGNFVGFVGLLPGIVPSISTESFGSDSISVNGQDPRNNNYMLDGGNNNDDVIGQRAGTQARTPIEAIQEFQVITGQYDAQYGRLPAGRQPDDEGFLRPAEGYREAGYALRALGRHGRRADREGQDSLLRQPRAVLDRSAEHHQYPGPSGSERHAAHQGSRLEHDRPGRSSVEQLEHLQHPLAA
jgi:hypothetical protein